MSINVVNQIPTAIVTAQCTLSATGGLCDMTDDGWCALYIQAHSCRYAHQCCSMYLSASIGSVDMQVGVY